MKVDGMHLFPAAWSEASCEQLEIGQVRVFTSQKVAAATAAKSVQSCPILCDPIDGSPPGFPVPGILQARTLECIAISFSNA